MIFQIEIETDEKIQYLFDSLSPSTLFKLTNVHDQRDSGWHEIRGLEIGHELKMNLVERNIVIVNSVSSITSN